MLHERIAVDPRPLSAGKVMASRLFRLAGLPGHPTAPDVIYVRQSAPFEGKKRLRVAWVEGLDTFFQHRRSVPKSRVQVQCLCVIVTKNTRRLHGSPNPHRHVTRHTQGIRASCYECVGLDHDHSCL